MSVTKRIFFLIILLWAMISTYMLFSRPQNITLEDDLTCEITRNPELLSSYILKNYGSDRSFSNINYYLYRHGYYLRNFTENKYIYISSGDGNVCWLRRFDVDTGKIVLWTNGNSKVTTIGGE